VQIPVGASNQFSPPPADRAQPTTFFTGRVVNVFTVKFNGSDLTWTLAGKTEKVSKLSKECAPNKPPVVTCDLQVSGQCQGVESRVKLDASGSTDPEGKPLSYAWTTNCPDSTIVSPTLASTDLIVRGPGKGLDVSCTAEVTVSDGVASTKATVTVSVPKCNLDCLGSPNGMAKVDQCGVCNGNNACVDCTGVPNGGKSVDKCGVCGGNNACVDCKGVPDGTTKVDKCGVCGGDNSSCKTECIETNIGDIQTQIDSSAHKMEAILQQILKRLSLNASDKRATARYVARTRQTADDLVGKAWVQVWTKFATISKNCAGVVGCAEIDQQAEIDTVVANSQGLVNLADDASRRLGRAKRGGLSVDDKKLLVAVKRLDQQNEALARQLPRFASVCS